MTDEKPSTGNGSSQESASIVPKAIHANFARMADELGIGIRRMIELWEGDMGKAMKLQERISATQDELEAIRREQDDAWTRVLGQLESARAAAEVGKTKEAKKLLLKAWKTESDVYNSDQGTPIGFLLTNPYDSDREDPNCECWLPGTE